MTEQMQLQTLNSITRNTNIVRKNNKIHTQPVRPCPLRPEASPRRVAACARPRHGRSSQGSSGRETAPVIVLHYMIVVIIIIIIVLLIICRVSLCGRPRASTQPGGSQGATRRPSQAHPPRRDAPAATSGAGGSDGLWDAQPRRLWLEPRAASRAASRATSRCL